MQEPKRFFGGASHPDEMASYFWEFPIAIRVLLWASGFGTRSEFTPNRKRLALLSGGMVFLISNLFGLAIAFTFEAILDDSVFVGFWWFVGLIIGVPTAVIIRSVIRVRSSDFKTEKLTSLVGDLATGVDQFKPLLPVVQFNIRNRILFRYAVLFVMGYLVTTPIEYKFYKSEVLIAWYKDFASTFEDENNLRFQSITLTQDRELKAVKSSLEIFYKNSLKNEKLNDTTFVFDVQSLRQRIDDYLSLKKRVTDSTSFINGVSVAALQEDLSLISDKLQSRDFYKDELVFKTPGLIASIDGLENSVLEYEKLIEDYKEASANVSPGVLELFYSLRSLYPDTIGYILRIATKVLVSYLFYLPAYYSISDGRRIRLESRSEKADLKQVLTSEKVGNDREELERELNQLDRRARGEGDDPGRRHQRRRQGEPGRVRAAGDAVALPRCGRRARKRDAPRTQNGSS